jgi:gamma-glutamyltranspeptidase/glutathione hydrolase
MVLRVKPLRRSPSVRAALLGLLALGCRTAAPPASAAHATQAAPVVAATPAARFERYAVVTDHPEASQAGAEVLAAGGTAADAAAAAMLALGVASPASSGLGGGGFALYYRASDRTVHFLDFRERAGAGTTAAALDPPPAASRGVDSSAPAARRPAGMAVGVPGEPRGIEALVRRFGALPLARVVAPAVRLAEEGFTPGSYFAAMSQRFVDALRADPLGRTWVPDGADGIAAGQRLRNPALAQTLRTLGAEGAAPFYEGPLAAQIVEATRALGGVLTADDLRTYQVIDRAPLEGERYGYRWVTAPPESAGGYTLLTSLGLLERWLPADTAASRPEADVLHALAESWPGAFLDRARYFGDPDFTPVPVAALLAPARLAARAALFDPARARPAADYDLPLPGTPPGPVAPVAPGAGTSHLCVADAAGNVASVTTTINIPFGAGRSVGGFWLNDELDDFTATNPTGDAAGLPDGGHNHPAPGRRPVSTMVPTLVFSGADPVLCVGGSGGTRIVTAVVQAAWRALVRGQPLGEAVAFPRIHRAASPAALSAEEGPAASVLDDLRGRGHTVEAMRFGAMVQALRLVRSGGRVALEAASDPRKGGRPAGR